jgi:uncharacterized protein YqeY
MLQDDIQTDLKEALKAGEETRLSVLRNIKSEIANELVAAGEKPDAELSDKVVQDVIARLAKQRRESIEEFAAGGRDDLVKKEQAELEILEECLPEAMSEAELDALVESKVAEVGAEDMSDMGQVMGAVMGEVGPATRGGDVRAVVEDKLQG